MSLPTWNKSLLAEVPETSYGFRTRLSYLLECLEQAGQPMDARTEVLEVGCGTGELLAVPLARRGLRVLGLDFHEPSIERAREHAAGTAATFDVRLAEDVAAEGNQFDVVICSEVLEHLNDPLSMLHTLRRLTKPCGLCFVTVPNGYGSYELAMQLKRWYLGSPLQVAYRSLVKPLVGVAGRRSRAQVSSNGGARPSSGETAHAEGGTLNWENTHVQNYTWSRLLRLFRLGGFRVARHQGRTLFCGPFLDRLVGRFDPSNRWNASLARRLPTLLAADWMFCLRPLPTPDAAKKH